MILEKLWILPFNFYCTDIYKDKPSTTKWTVANFYYNQSPSLNIRHQQIESRAL